MVGKLGRLSLEVWSFLALLFIATPILIILAASVMEGHITFPPEGLTLRWYVLAIERGEVFQSLRTSLWVATLTSLCATTLGVITAVTLARSSFRGRDALVNLFMLPLVFPAVMLGIVLLQWFNYIGLTRGVGALVLGHTLLTTPYVIRFAMASLLGLDPDLEKAAMNLGASPLRAFWRITIPGIVPGLVAGAAMSFIVSFDDLTLAVFLAGTRATTLPVRLYSYVQESFDPLIAATCGIMVFITVIFVILIERLVGMASLLKK